MRDATRSLPEPRERVLRRFLDFTAAEITPYADAWDAAGSVPREAIAAVARAGHFGALVPSGYGGGGYTMVDFGLLNEAIGTGCTSLRSILTVHSMVCRAIARWGTAEQRERWLPELAAGRRMAAFAISEAGAGSDVSAIATSARPDDGWYMLDGEKRWLTYGQVADLFLVFARCSGQITAFLVERDRPGLTVAPIRDILGTRASMLADARFCECRIPATAVLGRPGFGLVAVATDALDIGRYSVAWGAVGLAQACLELSLRHARRRRQFGAPLLDHQLVQRLITDMAAAVSAARLLCLRAGELMDAGDPALTPAIWMAKYFAATSAFRVASDTVQIHGASGCVAGAAAQRMFRDAKILEIIEGSTQIQQATIARLIGASVDDCDDV